MKDEAISFLGDSLGYALEHSYKVSSKTIKDILDNIAIKKIKGKQKCKL